MSMVVKDCLGQDFDSACMMLIDQVLKSYQPDLMVGVCSGGAIVASKIRMNPALTVDYVELTAQRQGTRYKKKFKLEWLLYFVPVVVCNMLRIWEMKRAIAKFDPTNIVVRDVIVDEVNIARIRKAKKILVVDDAVDSGATLVAVCNYLKNTNPQAEIKTAALTLTFPVPAIYPDFTLYKDVLLRFPWAADARRFR